MTFSLLVAALVGAAPQPRSLPNIDAVLYLPRLDKLDGLAAFSAHAGERSALLSPRMWSGFFHPFLQVDPFHASSLSSFGIDPAGDATINFTDDGRLICHTLSNPKLFEAKALEALSIFGKLATSTDAGVKKVTAGATDQMSGGYVVKGRQACATVSMGRTRELLSEAVKLLPRGSELPGGGALSGSAYGVLRQGLVAARATANTLTLEGWTPQLRLPMLARSEASPYGGMTPSGLLFVRGQVHPDAVKAAARLMRAQVLDVCPGCEPGLLGKVIDAIAPELTGNVLLRIDRVRVLEGLRTPAARYFSIRHAYLAEVARPAAVVDALRKLAGLTGVIPEQEGFALKVQGGVIHFGIHGHQLYVGNDPEALKAVLDHLPNGRTRLAHGAEFFLDPKLASRAISQLSFLDLISSTGDMSILLGLSTEVAPLLGITEAVRGWADSAGADSHRFQLVWQLRAPEVDRALSRLDGGALAAPGDAGAAPGPTHTTDAGAPAATARDAGP